MMVRKWQEVQETKRAHLTDVPAEQMTELGDAWR